ncbi:MAG: glutamate racemase [Clostridiales bacterium]|jgi:glutamate racemase|nr:glutamate racemase [Clostridiales bacterium]
MDDRPIGIFDSGVGGLTVAGEFLKLLPDEEIVYFGDTARVPYGSKSKEIVTKFSAQIVSFLIEKNVKAVVAACNTVSSNCYEALTARFDLPIIEVVSAGAGEAARITRNNTVGVIGTERTIASGAYERMIKAENPEIIVYSKACPLFVPLAEEGWINNSVAAAAAEIYLQELIDRDIDSLILGCTHYPLLTDIITRAAGGVSVINPAVQVARKMRALLEKRGMKRGKSDKPEHKFFVSDNSGKFDKISRIVLGKAYKAEIAEVEGY